MTKVKYGVKFIGYSAFVVGRKFGRETQHAMLDFLTDDVSINADGGHVLAKRTN